MATLQLLALFSVAPIVYSAQFLSINKTTNTFEYNGKTVFLSGANQPWDQYSDDFGNNQANGVFCNLNYTLANLSANAGNSVREWLFIDGSNIPEFNADGEVISTDAANSLIKDLTLYLNAAAEQNIFVFLVLWNGAVAMTEREMGLIYNMTKLQSFIDNALTPMVTALSTLPGLGGYEIINEPCGSILIASDSADCANTAKYLSGSGAGWTGSKIPMLAMQRFINVQTAAIHKADPKALVTVGVWNEKAATNAFGYFDFFSDLCLTAAGNAQGGTLDFAQLHTYAFNGQYDEHSPVNAQAKDFALTKPLLVGEFENQLSQMDYTAEYAHFYSAGYVGAWAWAMNTNDANGWRNIDVGVASLRGKEGVAVQIEGNAVAAARCWCSDVAPDSQYTCQQQAGWGKCNETFMAGFCCQSCHACQGCS